MKKNCITTKLSIILKIGHCLIIPSFLTINMTQKKLNGYLKKIESKMS